jgi:hypothetical protein
MEELVTEATIQKRQLLLIKDVPHQQVDKIKVVSGIRPARMGKHGIMIQPTRINKKKVKKMLRQQGLVKKILENVGSVDIEMK